MKASKGKRRVAAEPGAAADRGGSKRLQSEGCPWPLRQMSLSLRQAIVPSTRTFYVSQCASENHPFLIWHLAEAGVSNSHAFLGAP